MAGDIHHSPITHFSSGLRPHSVCMWVFLCVAFIENSEKIWTTVSST